MSLTLALGGAVFNRFIYSSSCVRLTKCRRQLLRVSYGRDRGLEEGDVHAGAGCEIVKRVFALSLLRCSVIMPSDDGRRLL